MRSVTHKTLFLLLFFLIGKNAFLVAQQEATLYFMSSLPQVTYNNPAFFPRHKFSIGLPGSSVFASYSNNGFSYNDLTVKQGDSVVVDLNKLQKSLAKKNYITTLAQVDLFRFSMKVNPRIYFTFNLTQKLYNRQMLPDGMFKIFSGGTGSFIGDNVSISPQVETTAYLESGWGAGYKVNKNLSVGLRFKVLKGVANVSTNKSTINLAVGTNYELTATGNVNVKTSGFHNLDDSNYDFADNWRDILNNGGFGFDLGASYIFFDRLTVGLSLIDIGRLKWKNDLYGYSLDPATATYTFEGIDLQKVLNGDTDYMQTQADSIEKNFTFKEGRIKSYTTPLPSKIYLSGNYQIRRNFTAGLLLFAEKFRGRFAPGVAASLNKDFGRMFSASVSYSATQQSFNNVGVGVSFVPIPALQLYAVSDHAMITDFTNLKYFTIRAGLNIVFGWDKVQERQPFPSKKK